MARIKGWAQTRKDAGATVWVSNEAQRRRIVVEKTPRGWVVLQNNNGMQDVIMKTLPTRTEAEASAVRLMRATKLQSPPAEPKQPKHIKLIEAKARRLMRGDWDGKPLDRIYYRILEDANFHTENSELTRKGAYGGYTEHEGFSGRKYYVPRRRTDDEEVMRRFAEYRRAGGRTWEL